MVSLPIPRVPRLSTSSSGLPATVNADGGRTDARAAVAAAGRHPARPKVIAVAYADDPAARLARSARGGEPRGRHAACWWIPYGRTADRCSTPFRATGSRLDRRAHAGSSARWLGRAARSAGNRAARPLRALTSSGSGGRRAMAAGGAGSARPRSAPSDELLGGAAEERHERREAPEPGGWRSRLPPRK